jgi:Ca2+-binding RTX toxin-like protein
LNSKLDNIDLDLLKKLLALIAGLEGDDKLTGNEGNDLFVYDSIDDGVDTITDFEVGSDKIVLTNLLARFDVVSPDSIAIAIFDLT